MPARSSLVTRELRAIRTALHQLQRAFDRLAPVLTAEHAAGPAKSRRKLRLTPDRRAALKRQGQYLGAMRGLTPTQRRKIKRIYATKGIRTAIAAAKRLSAR
jgi:hypothetical protein